MKIAPCTEIETVNVEEFQHSRPRIALRHKAHGDTVVVDGAMLEAQFSLSEDYLLFVSENSPFEEFLHILLLSSTMKVKDALGMGAPYTSGILQKLEIVGSNKISFAFFDSNEQWILEVREAPSLKIFPPRFPVSRKVSHWRKGWLQLRRVK